MIERITSFRNPHLFVMTYYNWAVNNLLIIPKFFFVPDIIEKRKPLADTARRAGWTGCNIEIGNIPESGKIFIVKNSWLLDVLKCVERIPTDDFCIDEVYAFTDELQRKHPDNNFVQDKIRQQLQYLRDKGFVQFVTRGRYRKIR